MSVLPVSCVVCAQILVVLSFSVFFFIYFFQVIRCFFRFVKFCFFAQDLGIINNSKHMVSNIASLVLSSEQYLFSSILYFSAFLSDLKKERNIIFRFCLDRRDIEEFF